MKKVSMFILAVVFAVFVVACGSSKKCPAYSKINKTEVSKYN